MRARVAYIVGEVRSGSTILDILLGSNTAVQSAGELGYLPLMWEKHSECSCGKPVDTCALWGQVRKEWLERTGEESPQRYLALKVLFERVRWMPRLWKERYAPSPQFRSYARLTRILYEVIQELSGKPIVVDSSKNPARAWALSMIPGIDLRLIHLVRDGRGVSWSRLKTAPGDPSRGLQETHPVPVWRSSLNWRITNVLSEYVSRQAIGGHIFIRYKDLFECPQKTVSSLGALLGTNLSALADIVRCRLPIEVGHIIAGNRVRKRQRVTLRFDNEWEQRLSEADRKIFWAIAGPMAQKYGYTK